MEMSNHTAVKRLGFAEVSKMNEQVKMYIEKYPAEIVDIFNVLRQVIYDSVPFDLAETMWAGLPSYYSDENFVRLIPFKDHINIESKAVMRHKEELSGCKITPKGMLQIYLKQNIPYEVLRQIFAETLGKQRLLIFNQMTEPEMYRMVHEIYSEVSMENTADKHSEFTYYVLDVDGQWVSALRLTKIDDFYYMEALETAPKYRRKGYAAVLIREVISYLNQFGPVKVRSCVNKKNAASLAAHRKCGFTIEKENGINYLCGEQYDHLYGMMYSSEPADELQIAIARICQMETYLDEVMQEMNTYPEMANNNPAIREKIQALKTYYESGLWLADYDRDSRGDIPMTLKRGVLSQDTLYNLFDEIDKL